MRVIVTVIGKDKSGITAGVMLCDLGGSKLGVAELGEALKKRGEEIGVSIHVQHEDIFNAMHKI